MTGNGTQNYPYIVDNWADFRTINTSSTGIYVRWADTENKVIDFNNIQPEGFSEPVTFPANVDFNGWKFKNLRINSGGIVHHNIQNIIIEDFIFSSEYGFSNAIINAGGNMENCVISGNIQYESSVSLLNNVTAVNCAFNVKIDTNSAFQLTNGTYRQFRNCDTALDITASEILLSYNYFSGQCYFRGNLNVTGNSPIRIESERGNIFDFYSNREIYYSGDGLCVYNSDKISKTDISSSNMKPCTTEQLKDAEYLYSIGFPIRNDKEPDFTLEQGDIFTSFGTPTYDTNTVRTIDYIPITTAYSDITVSARAYTTMLHRNAEVQIIGYNDTEISVSVPNSWTSQKTSPVTLDYSRFGDINRKKVNFFRVKVYVVRTYLLPENVEITITGNNYSWYIDKNGYPHGDDMPYAPARKPIVSAVPQRAYIIIYDKNTSQDGFNNNGLAVLEPISCTVTENFNASWTVTLEHPIDRDQKWKYIQEFNILKVLEQLFVIKKVEHSWSGNSGKVVAYAEHIFYHLNDRWIFKGADIYAESGYWLIRSILEHSDTKYQLGHTLYDFNFYSDITSENIDFDMPSIAYYKWNPLSNGMTPVEMLLGNDGFTANFGGDLYRDNFYFSINKKMEHALYDSFDIYVGLNLRGIRRTVDTSSLCTHFTASDKFGSAVSVSWSVHGGVPHHIVRSQEFSFGENYTESNMDLIGYEAKKYFGQHMEPQIDITVDLEDVKYNPEYSEFVNNPRYKVGDRGRIYDERLGISQDAFISNTVKDGITGKNLEITFSSTSGFTNMGDYDISVEETPVTPEIPDIPEEIID